MDLFQKQLDKKKRKNIDSNNKEKIYTMEAGYFILNDKRLSK